jgi:hypothetical protein
LAILAADIALPSTSAACLTNCIPAKFNDLDEFFYSLITKNVVDQKCLTQAGAYAAGYLLKKIKLSDECQICKNNLYSNQIEEEHLFTSFKEYNNESYRLKYASKQVVALLEKLHTSLYAFLDRDGYKKCVSKEIFFLNSFGDFCSIHNCHILFVDAAVTLLNFKYVKY